MHLIFRISFPYPVLLQKALDPPDPEVVKDALSFLLHIHSLERPLSPRGRYEPTYYGRLLASLPLSLDASILALKFGEIGRLREGILIGTLMDEQPLPILQPFGEHILVPLKCPCMIYMDVFGPVIFCF